MVTEFSQLSRRTRTFFGLSPWLVVGVSVILGSAVLFLALRGTEREKRRMQENLLERANALIWALEAGTRTWMGYEGERNVLQLLVEETVKQPGILYIAVAGMDGGVIAHSDRERLGEGFDRFVLPQEPDGDTAAWRETMMDGIPVFEVFRTFAPIRDDAGAAAHGSGGHHGGGRRQMRRGMTVGVPQPAAGSTVIVGLDQRPFTESLAADFHNTLLAAAIVAGLGLAGFISMFWAHSYRRSNRMLMDTRALASEVVTCLPMGLITSDPEGTITMANDAARTMLGRNDRALAGMPLHTVPGLDWAGVTENLSGKLKVLEREMELALENGATVPVRLSASEIRNAEGTMLGHVFILGDLGEVKRLQSEVQRNERLSALGNLAAGVAHEIRNPLSTIKGLATYMARKLPPGSGAEDAGKTMIEEVNRLNNVVSELLEFARPSTARNGSGNLDEIVARALRLADADIAAKAIKVDFQPGNGTPSIALDAGRFTQALLNLILNAVQAMDTGGTLRIRVERDPAGEGAWVRVEDNGAGMSDEVRKSVFDPYFTTKHSGTGLGLAIVHQIVEGHGGRIAIRSAPGAGSCFSVYLPASGARAPS